MMLDKRSGQNRLMSFGGFLGIGEQYHPLPWATLKYDTRQGGHVVGLTREQLQGAPTFARLPCLGDRAYETRIHDAHSRLLQDGAIGACERLRSDNHRSSARATSVLSAPGAVLSPS